MAMLVSVIALFRAKRRISFTVACTAMLLMWGAASPFFARVLAARLESAYPPRPVMRFPPADAIVVLGGGVEPATAPRTDVEMGEAADRLRLASRLYRAG